MTARVLGLLESKFHLDFLDPLGNPRINAASPTTALFLRRSLGSSATPYTKSHGRMCPHCPANEKDARIRYYECTGACRLPTRVLTRVRKVEGRRSGPVRCDVSYKPRLSMPSFRQRLSRRHIGGFFEIKDDASLPSRSKKGSRLENSTQPGAVP